MYAGLDIYGTYILSPEALMTEISMMDASPVLLPLVEAGATAFDGELIIEGFVESDDPDLAALSDFGFGVMVC